MKKLILLSVIALTFMACPNDDDTPPSETSIVGTWKYYKYIENGVEQPLENCESLDTLVFSANGDYTVEGYDDFNPEGTCQLDYTDTGTWSNTGNLYTITSDGETETLEINIEGNTFYIEDSYTFNGMTTTYRDVYIRQ